jgi:histidyl-tRNA synthetase
MKAADRSGARFAVIVGPGEIESDTLTLRPLRGNGEQRSIPRSALLSELQTISTVENNKRKAEQ